MRPMFLFVIGLLGAGLLSQAPAFAPQYLQNIDGEIDGMDTAIIEAGPGALPDTEDRRARLVDQQERLQAAGEFVRLYELAVGFDRRVAARALEQFEPALPLNAEGAASALAGFFVGRGVGALFLGGLAVFGFGRGRGEKKA